MSDYELKMTRRRYGQQTFTWVEVRLGDEWVSLGDPWPAVTPKRSEVEVAIKQVLKEAA